jgi:hypothetical protein
MEVKSKMLLLFLTALFLALVFVNCGKKRAEVKPLGEITSYKDPLYSFEISYPKEWSKNCIVGTARFYSTPDDQTRFSDPFSGAGRGGVEVKYAVEKSGEELIRIVKDFKDTMRAEQRIIDKEENIKVEGKEAIRIYLTSNYGKDNIMKSFRIFYVEDSLVCYVNCAAFNTDWEAYSQIFDAVVNSIKWAKKPTAATASAITEKPSDTFDSYTSNYFTVNYPDNFNFSSPPKGKNELSVEMKGYRLDCTVRFDVFPAQKLTVEKVVEQNKKNYKTTTATPTSIDGNSAFYMNYSTVKNVSSRVYFVVKNDKVIRVTLNWYTPESDIYKPVFEKVVASLKLK